VTYLPLLFIEVTYLEAGGSGVSSQSASGSSTPVNWVQVVLAYHHEELVVPANLCRLTVSSSDIPPQGARSSDKPVDECGLQCTAFKPGRGHTTEFLVQSPNLKADSSQHEPIVLT
jgi:hypothetical protein